MPFQFEDLDAVTRGFMVDEFDSDVQDGNLYLSGHFSVAGRERYPDLCRQALESGTDGTLAAALRKPGMFERQYQRRKPKGGYTTAAVPHTAPETVAEGEFNRFYLRGLCLRVLSEGGEQIQVYRARESAAPRRASMAMTGNVLDAQTLLHDLRQSIGVDTALGLPPGPNSGLSGRIPLGS
jgi:hypothetical protein